MFTLHANGVGNGIAIGTARIIRRSDEEIVEFSIAADAVGVEVERLQQAGRRAHASLSKIRDELPADTPGEISSLLGIHLMMLEDASLLEQPTLIIRHQQINAEAALNRHAIKLDKFFHALNTPYLSSKSADVAQVIHRIQGELSDSRAELRKLSQAITEEIADNEIIVANDLTPADAVELRRHRISAFITNLGGPISHTAILAKSMGIPAIVGLHDAIRYLRNGDLLIIDGKRGIVLVNPDEAALVIYRRRREKIHRRIQALDSLRDVEATTLDGETVSLLVNIKLPEEAADGAARNAQGVGLYRTEYLFMNRPEMPDEQEQLEVYSEVIKRAAGTVTIRTLDFGADKQPEGVRSTTTNPALGRRAIRLCLHDLGLFKPQLRAIYRASALGQVRIMLPMLCGVEELHQLFSLLESVKDELTREGYAFNAQIPIGGMIEVPAAAIVADLFAQKLDFLSIGTNDLIQYTLAIDRGDDEVNYLYDPLHPSVLRLIKTTIDAGKTANIPVSMCGEMAGDITYTRILLGLGLREFSMESTSLLEVKRQIRLTDTARVVSQVAELLTIAEPERAKEIVAIINK